MMMQICPFRVFVCQFEEEKRPARPALPDAVALGRQQEEVDLFVVTLMGD